MSAPRRSGGAWAVITLLCLYSSLVVWLTWPLGANLTTHLAEPKPWARFDTLFSAWALAWESHALLTDPAHFFDANIFHPASRALCYGPMGLGTLPYFMPTFLLTGNPALALNLTFLGSVALTAWSMHLVVSRWTGSQLGGFVAAWTLLMTRWILWEWAAIVPNYAVLQYFPLIVLLAAAPALRLATSLLLLALIVLQGLTDIYLVPAVLLPLGVLAVARLTRTQTRRSGLYLLGVLVPAAGVLLVAYSGHLLVHLENPLLHEQKWWVPTDRAVLPWGPFRPGLRTPAAVPWAALLLIAGGAVGRLLRPRGPRPAQNGDAWIHGMLWAAVGIVISLTPVAIWQGEPIALPHAFLGRLIPFYQAVRAPSRLGVAALVGLCVLAGVGFSECARWFARPAGRPVFALLGPGVLAALFAGAMYGDYAQSLGRPAFLSAPRSWPRRSMPTVLPSSYPIGQAIGPDSPMIELIRETGGPLLELPVGGPRHLSVYHSAEAMYRSIFHWEPLLNGYSSYWPTGFWKRMADARRLPAPEAVATLRRETNLAMILVHGQEMKPEERSVWNTIGQDGTRVDLRLIGRHGADVLFAVVPGPAGALSE